MDKQECIERQLESALLEGRWGVFERLPSERGLAEAFGVNRATVRAALRALAGRGILETRRGSGTVVRALPGDARHAAGTFADYLAAFRLTVWRWRGCCRSARCPSARTCSRSWRGC